MTFEAELYVLGRLLIAIGCWWAWWVALRWVWRLFRR